MIIESAQGQGGISVSGVRRSFGEVHAVRDATLEAKPGEVTALIGPNGSGKTTLMLMLASLLKPDAGSIRIAGHDPVSEAPAVRSTMGWMPDILGSWSSLSVRATLEITGRLYRLDKAQAAARASELIGLVALGELASQPTRVLSRLHRLVRPARRNRGRRGFAALLRRRDLLVESFATKFVSASQSAPR